MTVSEPIERTAEGKDAGHGASLVGVRGGPWTGRKTCWWPTGCPTQRCRTRRSRWSRTTREYALDGLTGWVEEDGIAQVARRQYVALKGEPAELSLRVGYDGVDQVVDGLTGGVDRGAAGGALPARLRWWGPAVR
ncbi:hypothetical protein [Nocardioides sp. B-3]|uniref:hypothetical protein n=1 Tax=Nocardioides sp. B-3 TaxID=2895565 RepID=UPI0021532A57|nr:hypothetical protein [Nocardioides sp. B-3]UUZ57919.1 hypothetical protein LP418_16355 [Nocardioides sp. B-3]